MKKVSIVYFSNTDITAELVQAVNEELLSLDIETFVYRIQGKDIVEGRFQNSQIFEHLHESHAIVFASPTYMGGVAAQFKAFADATSDFWIEQPWSGKYAAGITSGAAPNGDQSSTLGYFSTLASQHGMLWISLDLAYTYTDPELNRLGSQLGIVAQSVDGEVNEIDVNTSRYLATRIVRILDEK